MPPVCATPPGPRGRRTARRAPQDVRASTKRDAAALLTAGLLARGASCRRRRRLCGRFRVRLALLLAILRLPSWRSGQAPGEQALQDLPLPAALSPQRRAHSIVIGIVWLGARRCSPPPSPPSRRVALPWPAHPPRIRASASSPSIHVSACRRRRCDADSRAARWRVGAARPAPPHPTHPAAAPRRKSRISHHEPRASPAAWPLNPQHRNGPHAGHVLPSARRAFWLARQQDGLRCHRAVPCGRAVAASAARSLARRSHSAPWQPGCAASRLATAPR